MSRLALYLLGPPCIELDGKPIKLDRHKAVALLAYLAVTGKRQRRDALVNLLWPEYDSRRGRGALRRTLYALNQALPGPWLDVDREEVGLTIPPGHALWVDVLQFRLHLADCESHGHAPSSACAACLPPLTEAVTLARGEFLDGFSLKDSFNFDDWSLFQAEALRRELAAALQRLAHWHSAQREFEPALGYARRWLELDPLDEQAHRALMRLYTWSGRRSAALRQYEECVALLQEQLGVPPQGPTTELHQAIQEGRAPPLPRAAQEPAAEQPAFLKGEQDAEPPVFVAREHELTQLDGYLETAVAGQGQVVFVTGDAGSGKTALIQAFARRAQEAHPDLIVAGGQGNAQTGVGDPYLPFREILGLLSGDVQAQWAAGAMTGEQARRLWRLIPLTVEALVRTGSDLIDLLLPGAPLLERAQAVRPWPPESTALAHLGDLVARKTDTLGGIYALQQSALFEQYTQVLRVLAAHRPLLLAVDDLQWADGGSLDLLFHLGRRLAGNRILLLGAYRPADVAQGHPAFLPATEPLPGDHGLALGRGRPSMVLHPLKPVVNELKRTFGQIELNLERTEDRPFVEALLDSEPNGLGKPFRDALLEHTQGHPLFTVELLRGMQERGDLVQDDQGRWVEGPALDWETLPARVEAVVEERIGRLPPSLGALLRIASVEGETFAAEVVARVQATSVLDTVRHLSESLDRRHRLVSAQGISRLGSQRLSRYRFQHTLFQKYLYSTLDPVERAVLHEQVGTALEELCAEQDAAATAAIAPQLARHFEEAGIIEKAIPYLHQAGDRAVQLSAYREGITHLSRGLALLRTLPDSSQRSRQELTLQLTLSMALAGAVGTATPEVEEAYTRARQLCQETDQTAYLCHILGELSILYYVRAEYQTALDLTKEALEVAQRAQDPLLAAVNHWQQGFILFGLGAYEVARGHFEEVISFYDPQQHHQPLLRLRGSDAGVSALAYDACCLWCLGYPDQALSRRREALSLARDLGHPLSLADVMSYGGCMFDQMRRDAHALKEHAEELMHLARETGFPGWLSMGTCFQGEALILLGQLEEGLALVRQGIESNKARNVWCYVPGSLRALAEGQARAGAVSEGLSTVAQALARVDESDERHWEAELHRLRAELLLIQGGDETEATASLQHAIQAARRQRAKSWELRATTQLAHLWQAQGRTDDAREKLAEIYGWFTEGFDTPDLQEARTLLEALA